MPKPADYRITDNPTCSASKDPRQCTVYKGDLDLVSCQKLRPFDPMEYSSEKPEQRLGERPDIRVIDKDAADVAAQWSAGPDVIVDPQVSSRLR